MKDFVFPPFFMCSTSCCWSEFSQARLFESKLNVSKKRTPGFLNGVDRQDLRYNSVKNSIKSYFFCTHCSSEFPQHSGFHMTCIQRSFTQITRAPRVITWEGAKGLWVSTTSSNMELKTLFIWQYWMAGRLSLQYSSCLSSLWKWIDS